MSEAQSRVGAREAVLSDHDVLHAARELRPDDESAVGVIDGVVLYQDVFAGTGLLALRSGSALHADAVVASIDGVVHDEHVAAVANVDGVAVLRVPWAADGHSVDDDASAALRHDVESWRVLDGHALDEHVLAFGEADEMGAYALRLLCVRCHVLKMFQSVGIPQRTVIRCRSALFAIHVPFHVAHLAAFHGAPPFAVAVDDATARDRDVAGAAGGDARCGALFALSCRFVGFKVQRLVGSEHDDGVLLQMQVDVVLQPERCCQPHARPHVQMASALLGEGVDGLLNGVGAERQAVTDGSEVGQDSKSVHFPLLCSLLQCHKDNE